jgi:flagellar secretion chaperone FliS
LAYGRFAHEYQKQNVNGASPLQLVIMLYDGALRFMEAGKHAMAHGNLEKQNYYFQKSEKIVIELMSCLDMEKGGEVARNLFALYGYVLNELVSANIEDKPEPVERAIRVMSDLRESWSEIDKAARPTVEESAIAA